MNDNKTTHLDKNTTETTAQQTADATSSTKQPASASQAQSKNTAQSTASSVSSQKAGTHKANNRKRPNKKSTGQKRDTSQSGTAQANKQQSKPQQQQSTKTPTPSKPPKEAKRSGGLLAVLALLTGVVGTGLGVYNFDQARQRSGNDSSGALAEQLTAVKAQLATLNQQQTDNAGEQAQSLSALQSALAATKEDSSQRLIAIEQTQKGFVNSLQDEYSQLLDAQNTAVSGVLQRVEQLELGQRGLSQNLTRVSAADTALSNESLSKQEVGYLLRMAAYKVDIEGDVVAAAELLKMVEDKLSQDKTGDADTLIAAIRQKTIQLQGVTPVDSDALIMALQQMTTQVSSLQAKSSTVVDDDAIAADATSNAEEEGLLSRIGAVIASGIKYTPNDPESIDVSAQTALIEKRLIQADIRTAELAVRSHNSTLLSTSLASIRDSLRTYFAADETAKAMLQTLAAIESAQLETTLPDLNGLLVLFRQY